MSDVVQELRKEIEELADLVAVKEELEAAQLQVEKLKKEVQEEENHHITVTELREFEEEKVNSGEGTIERLQREARKAEETHEAYVSSPWRRIEDGETKFSDAQQRIAELELTLAGADQRNAELERQLANPRRWVSFSLCD